MQRPTTTSCQRIFGSLVIGYALLVTQLIAPPLFAQTVSDQSEPVQSDPAGDEELEGEWEDVSPSDGDDGEWEDASGDDAELEGEWEEGGASTAEPTDSETDSETFADPSPSPPPAPSDGPTDTLQPATSATEADPPPSVASPSAASPSAAAEPTAAAPPDPQIVFENAPSDVPITDLRDDDTAGIEDERPARRVGEPFPLTRREPLLGQWGFEAAIHYGLVGTGPTRLTNDVRIGIFDWWELRTTFAPYPAALTSRFKIGSQQGTFGALVLDAGLASLDAGVRLIDDEGESQVGPRAHFEVGIAYSRALGPSFSVYTSARFRYRLSPLKNDEQNVIAIDAAFTYDLLANLAITIGLGYSEVIGTPVRELSVNMVAVDRPGISHFLLRDDGWSRSVTVPFALTYGRVDSFDVDLFVTPRVYPQIDVMFGAGVRWRIAEIFNSKKTFGINTDFFDTSPR